MNNRRVIKQKNKTRDNMIIEILGVLEQDLSTLKLIIEIKDKQLNQYEKILRATKIEYEKITNGNKKLINELKK